MRLTVIGCSGSYAGPASTASAYLVEAPTADGAAGERPFRLLIDLGSGALGALQRHFDPLTVDAVLISHLHADHFFDLSGYYVLRKYHPAGPQPKLPTWGPRKLRSRVTRAYGLPLEPGMDEEFSFKAIKKKPFEVGPFTVTARRVDHPVEAFAFRIEHAGKALVYSGDTAPCRALTDLAKGADLLLAEASFRDGQDNPPHIHMTGCDAAATAAEAGVGRLVITLVPPWHDEQDALREARGSWGGSVSLAAEGATYDL